MHKDGGIQIPTSGFHFFLIDSQWWWQAKKQSKGTMEADQTLFKTFNNISFANVQMLSMHLSEYWQCVLAMNVNIAVFVYEKNP